MNWEARRKGESTRLGAGATEPRTPQPEQPLVIIVDDDATVREALSELILSAGFHPVGFASIRELLDADVLDNPGCLILDVRMPGASGLNLQPQANHLPDRAR